MSKAHSTNKDIIIIKKAMVVVSMERYKELLKKEVELDMYYQAKVLTYWDGWEEALEADHGKGDYKKQCKKIDDLYKEEQ